MKSTGWWRWPCAALMSKEVRAAETSLLTMAFAFMDTDASGGLTKMEFKEFITGCGVEKPLTDDEIDELYSLLDLIKSRRFARPEGVVGAVGGSRTKKTRRRTREEGLRGFPGSDARRGDTIRA